ncbi:MAG: ATPase, T2SS/T4P/T4SS family [bacterium]
MSQDKLGKILLLNRVVSDEQLSVAVARQEKMGQMLGEALIELGYASPDEIARALSVQLNIRFFELGEDFRLEKEEVKLVPEAIARRFCLIPVKKDSTPTITIVMRDPLDVDAVEAVRSLTMLEVRKAVSSEARIKAVIDKYYTEDAHIERNLRDIVELDAESPEAAVETGQVGSEQLRILANDAPVVRFVNLLLMQAVRDRASDIHCEPGEKEAHVRLRVDGRLREMTPPPQALYQAIVTRIKILANMDISERRLPLDGRFKFKVHDRIMDVRVSSLPEAHGEKLVLRILDRQALLVDMHDIGFEENMLQRFQRILQVPHGIILLTGPTGSGKTSTLYSALNFLKNPAWNIQTVEDPIEYLIPGINQMQVKSKIGLDFADALRSILRQDPDIIMIGEIRDLPTAQIAMRAALTGHLVLSTLHTNDAPTAFWRLRDLGVESYLIAATIKLVVAQRLVRVICGGCKQEKTLSPEELALAATLDPEAASWKYFHGVGCEKCGHTGFLGRTAVMEFLDATAPVRQMILDGTGAIDFRRKAIELGMEPLLAAGFRKVKDGVTTLDEVAELYAADGVN